MRLIAPSLTLVITLACAPLAQAANQQVPMFNNTYNQNLCPTVTMQVCGYSFTALAGAPGSAYTFNLPNRYVVTSVPVQCVTDGMSSYYKMTDTSAMSCILKTCKPTTIQVCENDIAIQAESAVGDVATQTLPPNLLASNASALAPGVSARCEFANGVAHYEFDENSVSCNLFACKPARLTACGSSVTVAQQADLGAMFQAETDTHKLVTIQCLGSEGRAPRYIVFEQNCN
jgi:hypothetical protein